MLRNDSVPFARSSNASISAAVVAGSLHRSRADDSVDIASCSKAELSRIRQVHSRSPMTNDTSSSRIVGVGPTDDALLPRTLRADLTAELAWAAGWCATEKLILDD